MPQSVANRRKFRQKDEITSNMTIHERNVKRYRTSGFAEDQCQGAGSLARQEAGHIENNGSGQAQPA